MSSRLRDLLVREVLTEPEYHADRTALDQHLQKMRAERERAAREDGILEPFQRAINLASRATLLFSNGTDDEKRHLVSITTSNLSLAARNLHIQAKEPYNSLMTLSQFPTWRTGRDSNPRSPP